MIFGLPLAIWFGILTITSVFITAIFGIATHIFKRNVLKFHIFFAFLTLVLALTHAVLAYLLWFKGIVV